VQFISITTFALLNVTYTRRLVEQINNFMVSQYLVTKSHLVISVFDSKI